MRSNRNVYSKGEAGVVMFKCPGCGREYKPDFKFPFTCMCGTKSYGEGVKTVEKKSRGLGDTIAKVTKKLGFKPCGGCQQRQAVLNRWVPYST